MRLLGMAKIGLKVLTNERKIVITEKQADAIYQMLKTFNESKNTYKYPCLTAGDQKTIIVEICGGIERETNERRTTRSIL